MKLKLGQAKNGWLPAVIEAEGQNYRFDISYLPNDFLLELTQALRASLQYEGEYRAVAVMEPEELEWNFLRIQDTLTLTLTCFPGSARTKGSGELVFLATGSLAEIIRPLWRGLNELSSRKFKEGFSTHWNAHWAHPFPHKELDKLTQLMDRSDGESV